MQLGADSSMGRKCYGDSGGPTYVDAETELIESLQVIGVTLRAYAAMEDCNIGGVDMRVDAFLDWIEEAMVQACDDGPRSERDEPGIPRPPLPNEGGDDDDGTCGGAWDSGCSGGNPVQWHGGDPHALGLSLLWRRRSQSAQAPHEPLEEPTRRRGSDRRSDGCFGGRGGTACANLEDRTADMVESADSFVLLPELREVLAVARGVGDDLDPLDQ